MKSPEIQFGPIDKIIFFGGGEALYRVACSLQKQGVQQIVVTSVRHAAELLPNGSAFEVALRTAGIKVLISADVNTDSVVQKEITAATFGISLGAAWIFKPPFISLFGGRLVNSHGTRLPQYRGGGGFSWQIMNKNHIGFVLLHLVDGGIDTGQVAAYQEFFYPTACRIPADFQSVYIDKNVLLVEGFIKNALAGMAFPLLSQQEYFSQYWPRLATDIHGWLDWSWPLLDLERFICAFDHPYRGASTFVGGQRVWLKDCLIDTNDGRFHPFQKGIVYRKRNHAAFIATEDGTLIARSITTEDGSDYFALLQAGDRLYTPIQYLEEAKAFRAIYTPTGLKK